MKPLNKLRTLPIFIALMGLILVVVGAYVDLNVEIWNTIIQMVGGVLVATGILGQTSGEVQPLTKETFVEKLKSPVAIGAIIMLVQFIVSLGMDMTQTEIVMNFIRLMLMGLGVINNPNIRDAIT